MQWSISGNLATFTGAQWTWRVDLAHPSAGVSIEGPTKAPWQLMAIHPVPAHACQIDDQFARGSDLMVRYVQSEKDQFAFQLDFRAVPPSELASAACGFDVWLSVQTQLLDAHPQLEINHPGATKGWSGDASIQNHASPSGCAAILIHPSDLLQTELIDQNAGKLRLFGDFMEKGVIRRGRLRCLVSAKPIPASDLQAAYDCFADSPLPLTT